MRRLMIAIAFAAITLPANAENAIVGTWRIVSFVREVVPTGERQNEFGDKPDGYISYQPDGRRRAVAPDNHRKHAAQCQR